MKGFPRASSLFSVFLLAAALCGCAERGGDAALAETEEPAFRRAAQLARSGRANQALESYLKLIQKRHGEAPESHLEAGRLYLNHIEDPVSAIYHFRRYKALLDAGVGVEDVERRAALADELVKTAMKQFASGFEAQIFRDPLERIDLMDTIKRLAEDNERLKRELVQAKRSARSAAASAEAQSDVPSGEQAARRPPERRSEPSSPTSSRPGESGESQRTYIVQPGDTLYRISQRVYGTGSRWLEILEANRASLPDPQQLRVGDTLVIP